MDISERYLWIVKGGIPVEGVINLLDIYFSAMTLYDSKAVGQCFS